MLYFFDHNYLIKERQAPTLEMRSKSGSLSATSFTSTTDNRDSEGV